MRQAPPAERTNVQQVSIAGTGFPRPEYAPPLVPPWVATLALLLLAWPASRARTVAMAVAPPRQGPCGPAWQVATPRSVSFTLRAIGPAVGSPSPCTIVVGTGAVLHASGDAALIRPSGAAGTWLFVPEGSWWGVPLARQGTLQVLPFHPGSHLQLAIYNQQQFAALR